MIDEVGVASTAASTAYVPADINLVGGWTGSYAYLPDCDAGLVKNDTTTGWNPWPDLTDGQSVDGVTGTSSDWNGRPKVLSVLFDLGRPCRVSQVVVVAKVTGARDAASVRLAVAAGEDKAALVEVAPVSQPIATGKEYGRIAVTVSSPARFVRVRMESACTGAHGLEIGEVEILGVPDHRRGEALEISGLTPGRSYRLSLGDAQGRRQTCTVAIPPLLRDDLLDDAFGLNVHLEHLFPDRARVEQAVDLIAASGVKYVRWYPCGGWEKVLDCLRQRGIDTFMIGEHRNGRVLGIGNEPELKKRKPVEVVERLRQARTKSTPGALLGGPVCMSESTDYVNEFMGLLRPGDMDFFDFHPYIKRSTPVAPGLCIDAPENVVADYRANREILARHGGAGLPLVASEFGYSTFTGSSWLRGVTDQEQASMLARSFLAHFAEGARLAIWYDFRDDGPKDTNLEHRFGVVRQDLTLKPAYHALRTLTSLTAGLGWPQRLESLAAPVIGYRCVAADRSRTLTAICDAVQRSRLAVRLPADDRPRFLDVAGASVEPTVGDAGWVEVEVDGAPLYIVSRGQPEIRLLSSRPRLLTQALGLAVPPVSLVYREGATLDLAATNPAAEAVAVTVECRVAGRPIAPAITANIAPGQQRSFSLPLPPPAPGPGAVISEVELAVRAAGWPESVSRHHLLNPGRRTLPAAEACDLNGDGKAEVILENSALFVIVAPAAGGRVLRVIDRADWRDQLYVSATSGGGFRSCEDDLIAGEWLALGTDFGGPLPGLPFTAEPYVRDGSAGVRLSAEVDGWKVEHTVELPAGQTRWLHQEYRVVNAGSKPRELRLRSHPEFVPGGAISFGKVDITIPSAGREQGNAFMSFRGDVGTTVPDQGWWRVVNTENGYVIKARFVIDQVAGIRQWHAGDYFNMEMDFHRPTLAPGTAHTVAYDYAFNPGE